MGKRLIVVLTLVLAVVTTGAVLTYAGARGFRDAGARQGCGDGPFANLTEEQRAEIRALVETQKGAGATREEIRQAIGAKLQEFGIDLPADWGQRQARGDGPFANLTEEQRAAIQEMREAGATRQAVREQLTAWGIELPERQGPRHRGGDGPFASLTEEQRAEIRALVQEMKAKDAPREDIREAVRAKLEEWGVELPRRFCDPEAESAAEPEGTVQAKASSGTAVESGSWGKVKGQFR